MDIELPKFVPQPDPHQSSADHKYTSIPDVWRNYDVDKADRKEPAADTLPIPVIEAV